MASDPGPMHGGEMIDPAPHRPSRRRLILTAAAGVVVVSALAVAGMVPRWRAAREARDDRERLANEPAHVQVERPARPA